jgi:hypothetical protein
MQRSSIALSALLFLAACSPETIDAGTSTDTSTDPTTGATTNPAQVDAPPAQDVAAPLAPAAGGTPRGDGCPVCPPTLDRCDSLDIACEPLGISPEDCVEMNNLCVKGADRDHVCKFAVEAATLGDPALVCDCAFTACPA